MSTNPPYDLSAVLAKLFYGDESHEKLDRTLDRLLSTNFTQRINGQVYNREAYGPHVREMRQMVTGNGELRVIEEVRQGPAIAGRYIFSLDTAGGRVAFESHVFAEIDDHEKVLRLVEVARQLSPQDSAEILTPIQTAG